MVDAYTFELGKCYEQAIRERQLTALANIDTDLCQRVAGGLGLPAPEPALEPSEQQTSPAVSQLGRTWPVAGRIVGIITDANSDPKLVLEARDAITAAGMLALLVAPVGGQLLETDEPVQRTYATARSVEFDALVLATSESAAEDAGDPGLIDARVTVMVSEAFRHAKAIGGWGNAATVLQEAGVNVGADGIVQGSPEEVVSALVSLLAEHRVWNRATARR